MKTVIAFSLVLLIAVTVFMRQAGLFAMTGGIAGGLDVALVVFLYGFFWAAPSLIALVAWAIWFRRA